MKGSGVLLLIAFVILLEARPRLADAIEGGVNGLTSSAEKNNTVRELAPPDRVNADKGEKAKDASKESQNETKGNSGKIESEDKPNERKEDPLKEPKSGENVGSKDSGGELESKTLPLQDSHVDECDPSNRCNDEKNKFIACLRVPGTDSLALSLLVENIGTTLLDVSIIAPDFVSLEQTTVQLQGKRNIEVKVSVSDGATNDTMIVLKAGEGRCSLSLRNMIPDSVRNEASKISGYYTLRSRVASLCMLLAVLILIGAALLYNKFRRMYRHDAGPMYQKVDMSLPVSTTGKKEAGEPDQWDNSWGDNWEDEEAPMTPSKPSPNPSSKGLAPRRSMKDGWKD
ncbi:uncharacterized protein [Typha latifolia]|uniref:uncharacterized protein isoform X1 n=1 Tax=Typha latifolia TaxID=4733 RepID=UPI003C30E5D4